MRRTSSKKSGPAFSAVEGSKIEAVMSRNKEKARSYAQRHHIPKWYTDAQELINDPEVNAIYIATPPSSHATFAIMAMKAGKPVYVEKPLAASYEECARVNRISEQTGVPCFVAYYRRYLPYFTVTTYHGAYNETSQEAVIFMTWLLISSTCFRNCSDLSLKQRDSVPTAVDCIQRKTASAQLSSLPTDFQVQAHGALSHTNRPRQTVLKSLATTDRYVSLYTHTTLSHCIQKEDVKKS